MSSSVSPPRSSLARVLGVPGAVMMGLGSIVGTGIFVSIGTAAGVAGGSVIIAVALAAVVATCNGLSSAQLAASHPVSGGAYEYGYRYLNPTLGFVAGWMFLCAKTASAATAALGFGGYALGVASVADRRVQIALGVGAVVALTAIVAGGIRRSNRTNIAIVAITLGALVVFVVGGAPHVDASRIHLGTTSARAIAHATALMFVAYTGYGRIATLGEEVRRPERTVPRAIVTTLVITLVLYVAVTTVAIGIRGADALAAATRAGNAPLEAIARSQSVRYAVAIGAVTAMLGVILNLVLGLSRVVLAMARRGDLPRGLAQVDQASPRRAVLVTGIAIAVITLIGSVETTWSFSAFTVLVYYAINNLCVLRQPRDERRFPRAIAVIGLASCLGLAFWVEPTIWLVGLALIGAGVAARAIILRLRRT